MMDFTTEEKRMILHGLEDTYSHLVERIDMAVLAAQKGIRYEGEALEAVARCYSQYESLLVIENKIFSSLENDSLKEEMMNECQEALEQLRSHKKTLGITEDVREPETANS